ncbi:MAG TPA: hypothetical protein VJX94_12145 [Stellaceae bacterium]|nr:hypothetical protein [Stellaceae bacterium]
MLSIAKTGPCLLELAVALDVNVEGPIGQDVGDLFVIEKRLEWPEADHVVGELGGERGFFDLVELYVLLCRDLAHQVGDFRAQHRTRHTTCHGRVDPGHQNRPDLLLELTQHG